MSIRLVAAGLVLLAGVGAGIFASVTDAAQMVDHPERFDPQMTETVRGEHLARWHEAVRRTRSSGGGRALELLPEPHPGPPRTGSGLEDDVN